MRFVILIATFFILNNFTAFSCTTFILEDKNNLVFGRNLDWVSDHGLVVVNKRGIKKTALVFPPEIPVEWTSNYGSLTFNQFGKEFPYGGINEKGLVIEIMRSNADYPKPDQRPALNELQWVQYQLDKSSTVNDVIQSDKFLRISAVKEELHFLICDKNGNKAVIEFKNGKLNVFKNQNLPQPVLANSYYPDDLSRFNNKESCRFTTVAHKLKGFKTQKKNAVNYSFDILNKVALQGSWSIVYDIQNMQVYFKSASQKSQKHINLNTLDFSCNTTSVIYPINTSKSGLINTFFYPYNHSINTTIIKDAMKTNQIKLPKPIAQTFYDYAKTTVCL